MSALQKIASHMTRIPQRDLREVAGDERVLHRPDELEAAVGQLFLDAPAAREAARAARCHRRRDGPPAAALAARAGSLSGLGYLGARRDLALSITRSSRPAVAGPSGGWRPSLPGSGYSSLVRAASDPGAPGAGTLGAMGLGNILFGRKKLGGAKLDRLFALSTARSRSRASSGCGRRAWPAVVFKPLSAGEFMRAEQEIDELLGVAARRLGLRGPPRATDSFGFQWLVVRDTDLEDLVTTVHLVALRAGRRAASATSSSPRSSASRATSARSTSSTAYKRGTFWPFVPTGEDQERDNARGAAAEERAREGAPDRASARALARALRRAARLS